MKIIDDLTNTLNPQNLISKIKDLISNSNSAVYSVNGVTANENGDVPVNLLDYCHPIGSLYWSENDTDPAKLFGGTWEQIKDKFILAAGDTYAQGATGGAATVTLTTNQIPSHNHTGTAASTGSHTHTISRTFRYGGDPNRNDATAAWDIGDRYVSTNVSVTSSSNGSHSHNVTINSTGGGAAHNNMPPYVTYYCWKRTA